MTQVVKPLLPFSASEYVNSVDQNPAFENLLHLILRLHATPPSGHVLHIPCKTFVNILRESSRAETLLNKLNIDGPLE